MLCPKCEKTVRFSDEEKRRAKSAGFVLHTCSTCGHVFRASYTQMLKTKEQREFDAQQKLDAANAKQIEYDKKDNILKSLGYEKRITPSGAAHYVYTGKGAPHIDNGWAKDRGDLTDSEATRVADAIRANR